MSTIHVEPSAEAHDYGPRAPIGEPRKCRTCTRAIDPAERAHVCRACKIRKCRRAQLGEACAVCGLSDRRMLCLRDLADVARVTLCGSHAVLLGRRPLTLEALRAEAALPAIVAA